VQTNADTVVHLVDALRKESPDARFYHASSGEMFARVPGGEVVHDETSPLNPPRPHAAANAQRISSAEAAASRTPVDRMMIVRQHRSGGVAEEGSESD
jgi:nucleoside-diphosphate-sugar epimerase